MKYKRQLSDAIHKTAHSILLLGPRQTGKSTLIRELNPDITINLAREAEFLDFSSDPTLLEKIIQTKNPRTIFVDEVQRLPSLLNTLQAIIDENPKKYKFYLTGSSARKLKRGQANLLPGRVLVYHLGPLTFQEIGNDLYLDSALVMGTLPGILTEKNDKEQKALLTSYASTYLKEEVQAEALTKNIEGFARFLFVAASKSGEFLDYQKLGSQAAIDQKTSSRFFEILEDTLIVNRIEAFSKSETRRLIQHPKFYFFDVGVLNGLLKNFSLSVDRRGFLFEHFIVNQILTLNKQFGGMARISTYRTEAGSEVDLIIEREGTLMAVEIKSSPRLTFKDFNGLKSFKDFLGKNHQSILIYTGQKEYREEFIEVLSWKTALNVVISFLACEIKITRKDPK